MKVNTDATFSGRKFGIEILVRNHLGILLLENIVLHNGSFAIDYGEMLGSSNIHNHLGISLLANFVPRNRSSAIDYGEMLGIIQGYSVGFDFSIKLLLDSNSFLAVRSLLGESADLSELRAPAPGFLAEVEIDRGSASFSHVRRVRNVPIHLLVRIPFYSNVFLEWSRNIIHNVTQTILLDLYKI